MQSMIQFSMPKYNSTFKQQFTTKSRHSPLSLTTHHLISECYVKHTKPSGPADIKARKHCGSSM